MEVSVSDKVEHFFEKFSLRKYAKGQILLLSGDHSENIYFLLEGKVKVYDVNYRGDEVILNVFKPGAFFPMSQAINKDSSNPYIYEAETDIMLRQAPNDAVVSFIKDNPDVMFDLLSRVYKGADGLLGRMAYLMSSSARSRLMYELLIEIKRFGKEIAQNKWEIHISEKDLGARAGLTRETVSREMQKLKKENLITAESKRFIINDFELLQTKLGHGF